MDLKGLANLTLKEKCSTQDNSIQSIISDHLSARCEVFRGLVEVRAKVTIFSLLICHFIQIGNISTSGLGEQRWRQAL